MFADVPFRGVGQLGLDERELHESGECSPAASGAVLLDIDGSDSPFGFIPGEGAEVGAGGEPQDQVLKAEEAAADAPKVTT